jgi:hypothetical protein
MEAKKEHRFRWAAFPDCASGPALGGRFCIAVVWTFSKYSSTFNLFNMVHSLGWILALKVNIFSEG